MIGNAGCADRTKIDRIKRLQAVECVLAHHRAGTLVVLAPPRKLGKLKDTRLTTYGLLQYVDSGRNDFGADPVTSDDGNTVGGRWGSHHHARVTCPVV